LFTLVESQSQRHHCMLETGRCINLECVESEPDLGVASLLASCGQSQIKTHLVRASTRYLKDVLMTDSDELVRILTQDQIPTPDCLTAMVQMLRNSIHDYGEEWFKELLENVYKTLRSREVGDYLSIPRLKLSRNLVNCILSIYGTFIIQKRGGELSFVRRLYEEIKRSRPDVVGFSIKPGLGVSSDPFFAEVSQLVKDELDIPIIVGGQFTTGEPVETLHSSLTLSLKNIDYLIRGNADLSLPELIRVIEDGKTPRNVPNVSFRENGKIVSNRSELIRDLDALPIPDFSQFDLDALPVRVLPMLTARGCPWRKCAFCSHYGNYGNYYVCLSMDKVIQTIREYREKYRTHFILFRDETLTSQRARNISSSLIQERIDDVCISTYGRLDDGYTRDLLSLMFKAGFRVIFWGLESGCQRILNRMNKGIEIDVASRILRDSHEAGMANFCFVMFGFPGEERKEAMETFRFLSKHRNYVDLISPNLFSISKGSPIERNPGRWGVVIDNSEYGYHAESGLQPYEVSELSCEMSKQVSSIVSDRFMDWWRERALPHPYWRNLLFIFHSKGLLNDGYVKRVIADRRTWSVLFPVFTGYLRDWNSKRIVTSNFQFWARTPSNYIFLNDFEDTLRSLANGTNSLSTILDSYRKAQPFENDEEVARGMLKFIESLMKIHSVVFFSKGFDNSELSKVKLAPSQ
jgi:radical SAM superfamily enzyme YgiQ (UPF0313 family)